MTHPPDSVTSGNFRKLDRDDTISSPKDIFLTVNHAAAHHQPDDAVCPLFRPHIVCQPWSLSRTVTDATSPVFLVCVISCLIPNPLPAIQSVSSRSKRARPNSLKPKALPVTTAATTAAAASEAAAAGPGSSSSSEIKPSWNTPTLPNSEFLCVSADSEPRRSSLADSAALAPAPDEIGHYPQASHPALRKSDGPRIPTPRHISPLSV